MQKRGQGKLAGFFRSRATSGVTAARATPLCLGGQQWWTGDGATTASSMMRGEFFEAESRQAEALAGPFDVDVDFNWPQSKMMAIVAASLPSDRSWSEGDQVVLGDGDGRRELARIELRDGALAVAIVSGSTSHPTWDIFGDANDESLRICSAAFDDSG